MVTEFESINLTMNATRSRPLDWVGFFRVNL
jgi:hypothetical protein